MELKEQKYVVTLADTGNLTRAAKKLGISQPALSLYIKNLETQFGELLFSRENRKITPTLLGELYIAHAREILDIASKFHAELESLQSGAQGRVSFGLTFSQSPIILPVILPDFKELYPDIDVDVKEAANEEELLDLLKDRKIDFAVMEGEFSDFDQTLITKDQVVLLISNKSDFARKHKAKAEKKIDPEELNGLHFLVHAPYEDTVNHSGYLKNTYNISANQVMPLKSMESILLLVEQNFGATLISEKQLGNYDLTNIDKFYIADPAYAKSTYTTTRADEKTSDHAEVLMKLIHDHFGKK